MERAAVAAVARRASLRERIVHIPSISWNAGIATLICRSCNDREAETEPRLPSFTPDCDGNATTINSHTYPAVKSRHCCLPAGSLQGLNCPAQQTRSPPAGSSDKLEPADSVAQTSHPFGSRSDSGMGQLGSEAAKTRQPAKAANRPHHFLQI